PPSGGSHGNPHRTTKILSHARRRGGGVAARGARAADSDASDRVLSQRGARRLCILCDHVPQWSEEGRLHRGPNVAVECSRAEGQLREGGSPCNIETAHLRWW